MEPVRRACPGASRAPDAPSNSTALPRPRSLTLNLGVFLRARGKLMGERIDIDRGIELIGKAAGGPCGVDSSSRPRSVAGRPRGWADHEPRKRISRDGETAREGQSRHSPGAKGSERFVLYGNDAPGRGTPPLRSRSKTGTTEKTESTTPGCGALPEADSRRVRAVFRGTRHRE